MNDYKSAEEAPWYSLRSHINKIIIKDSITHIGSFAFSGAAVKEIVFEGNIVSFKNSAIEYCYYLQTVSYNGKISDWKKINFQQDCFDGSYNGRWSLIVVYCTDDTILGQGNCGADGDNLRWLLTESKKLVIWGNGKMANYISSSTPSPWWSKDYTTVSFEGDIVSIGDSAFYYTPLNNIVLPDGIIDIGKGAFENAKELSEIQIPNSVNSMGAYVFDGCDSLREIIYDGTISQWNEIDIEFLNHIIYQCTIHCSDGDILPTATSNLSSEENSIIPSTDTTISGNNYVASFTGLTPGVNYAVIVSESSVNPLDPAELIYINQFKANDSGAYQQSFRTKSGITDADMTYVVAAGSYTFDDTPVTPGGGDSGSGGSSGGGGGGGGAAVILGVGVAVAITAGVILTMPVDVQGRVELANHAAVPGAKVSLLKNGNVVTQTTADESGHFSLKAKRGDYELTVVYTDANGQLVQKTTRIKAPAKDFVVTF